MDQFNHVSSLVDTDLLQKWAVRLPANLVASSSEASGTDCSAERRPIGDRCLELIGSLRLNREISVCIDAQSVWLRGVGLDDQISRTLRSLPGCERFLVLEDGQLVGWDESVPRLRLPTQMWQSLAEWLSIELPIPPFAGLIDHKIPLRLVRTDVPVEANLLKTSWQIWRDYASDAPQIRLNRLSFAVSAGREVLILGWPLPPVPGQRLVEADRVAIPAGFRTEPSIDSASIRRLLRLLPEEFAVYRENGSVEIVPGSAFVLATRSAVRLTDASFEDSPAASAEPRQLDDHSADRT